jgi:hypothetical protein
MIKSSILLNSGKYADYDECKSPRLLNISLFVEENISIYLVPQVTQWHVSGRYQIFSPFLLAVCIVRDTVSQDNPDIYRD